MDRRAGGIAMLILVLLAAAIVPNIATRVVSGRPEPAPVPGPPAIGDCVTSVPPGLFSGAGSKYLVVPPMQYGNCSEGHYGEVTAVLPHVPLQRNPIQIDRGSGYELWNLCPTAGLEYAGLTDPATGNAADPAAWIPSLNAGFVFAGPDARQKASGQTWGACVLTAAGAVEDQPLQYSGSARGSVNGGRLPWMFGACTADTTENASQVPCTERHGVQILAQAELTTSDTSSTTRLADCAQVARRVTRMPDPTAGGRLVLAVRVDRYDAAGDPSRSTGPLRKSETQYGTCTIATAGAATLHGSLFGLGADPVPLG
jgi:hypothetical protein